MAAEVPGYFFCRPLHHHILFTTAKLVKSEKQMCGSPLYLVLYV